MRDYRKKSLRNADPEARPSGDHRFIDPSPTPVVGIDDSQYRPSEVQNGGPAKRNHPADKRLLKQSRANDARYRSDERCGNLQGCKSSPTRPRVYTKQFKHRPEADHA